MENAMREQEPTKIAVGTTKEECVEYVRKSGSYLPNCTYKYDFDVIMAALNSRRERKIAYYWVCNHVNTILANFTDEQKQQFADALYAATPKEYDGDQKGSMEL